MNVGLYVLENYPNTAAMMVSTYHKQLGDTVEMYNHLTPGEYDKVYAFSLFDDTPKCYVGKNMICGGTGFDIESRLPPEIEACSLDWTLYPDCDYSMVWFSRGCIRKCPFCVVPRKEGGIHPVAPKNLNPRGRRVLIMDNNFFANPEWNGAVRQLKAWGQPVNFHQGFDIRILSPEICETIRSLRQDGLHHFSWDNPRLDVVPNIRELLGYVNPARLACYVLIGYWSTMAEDLYRVKTLDDLGVSPYVMPFNRGDEYQRRFARWVNHKATFKSCKWEEYTG